MEQEVIAILNDINPYVEINNTSKLLDGEVLDSLGILLFISELEAKYSISMPLEKLNIEDFETVSAVVKLVETCMGGGQ